MKLTPLEPWISAKIGLPDKTLTRQVLIAYQLMKLNATLQLARARSPFYRTRLAGFPAQLDSLEDLKNLPFTTGEHIRSEGLQFLCVSQDEIHRVVTLDTSGTSGAPKRLFFTSDDQELTIDFFGAGMSTLVDPGDRVLILLPGNTPGSVGDLLFKGLQRSGVTAIKHGPVKNPGQTLAKVEEERVNSLVGVPTQVLSLARFRGESGKAVPLQLKSVLLSTDHVPEAIVKALKSAWGCEVYNHYGMTEMGLGGGVSCFAQTGYHLREADLYFEIVDPISGEPLADGETGEVVFTTLNRQGMPLIRYRTGDLSRFIPTLCPCGTILKTMEFIKTRSNSFVRLKNGVISMAELDESLFNIEGVLNYSAGVMPAGMKNHLRLEVFMTQQMEQRLADIYNALETIPALKDTGLADVIVSVRVGNPSDLGSMAKRKIFQA